MERAGEKVPPSEKDNNDFHFNRGTAFDVSLFAHRRPPWASMRQAQQL